MSSGAARLSYSSCTRSRPHQQGVKVPFLPIFVKRDKLCFISKVTSPAPEGNLHDLSQWNTKLIKLQVSKNIFTQKLAQKKKKKKGEMCFGMPKESTVSSYAVSHYSAESLNNPGGKVNVYSKTEAETSY